MSEHKLQRGKLVIEGLSDLGTALGYFVQREQPVVKDAHWPPAVDVAWKKDEWQDFPLLIFEVESSAGNTIANNALKVYSQPNQDFEKPLFFFHLIVRSGTETSRIEALRRQYGTNNYRLYRLDTDEATGLIQDILTQHRKVFLHFDVAAICGILQTDWAAIDLSAVLDHAETLNFETSFLTAYARLSADEQFLARFVDRLSVLEERGQLRHRRVPYETFLGESWHPPIHLAILARARTQSADVFLEQLRNWQEESYPYSMIGPHFGMSRDYDQFILGMSSGLLSAIAAIFGNGNAKRYIAAQMHSICEQLGNARDRFALYAGVWLLHVTASVGDELLFEYARNFVNSRGGLSSGCVSDPPFLVPSFEELDDCEWDHRLVQDKKLILSLPEFVQDTYGDIRDRMDIGAIRLGIRLLAEPEWTDGFGLATFTILGSERNRLAGK
ncbi:MAG: hypothetical protein V7609_1025 [Verrucomicrobiota bacterium]